MAKTNNIIEINGQRYDALTGVPVGSGVTSQKTGHNIDGIVHSSKSQVALAHLSKAVPAAVPITVKPSMSDVVGVVKQKTARPAPIVAAAHKPEAGKTLMRHAVHKPGSSFKRQVKVQSGHSLALQQPQQVVAAKQAVHSVDNERLARAQQTPHNQHIKRFHKQPVALQSSSVTPIVHPMLPTATSLATVQTAPRHDVFEKALQQATSHHQPSVATEKELRRRRVSKRLLSLTAGSFAAVALVGFGIVQNWSNISVHLAASRAGFAASLPSYQPAGYRVGQITTSTGSVAVRFASNSSDNRNYTLTEKVSDWDSQTLRDMFVNNTSHSNFQTTQAGGQTIYLYGNRTATWVNAGIWYTITSNGSLSDNQLVNLATSL